MAKLAAGGGRLEYLIGSRLPAPAGGALAAGGGRRGGGEQARSANRCAPRGDSGPDKSTGLLAQKWAGRDAEPNNRTRPGFASATPACRPTSRPRPRRLLERQSISPTSPKEGHGTGATHTFLDLLAKIKYSIYSY